MLNYIILKILGKRDSIDLTNAVSALELDDLLFNSEEQLIQAPLNSIRKGKEIN